MAVGVGLELTDGDGAPVNLAAASARHAQRMQNFFILVLDINLCFLFERNAIAWLHQQLYLGEAEGDAAGDAAGGVKMTFSILARRQRCTLA